MSRAYLHPYQRLVRVINASTVIIRYRKASARPDVLHPSAHDSPMSRNAVHIDLSVLLSKEWTLDTSSHAHFSRTASLSSRQCYIQACSISLSSPHDEVNSVHAPFNREIDSLDDDYEDVQS
jgi:hypothetical protein